MSTKDRLLSHLKKGKGNWVSGGHILEKTPELLLPNEIREGLDTKVFGKTDIVYFRETDSTNTRAKDLAVGGAQEGTLVLSESQKKGKGRKGRKWFSPSQEGIYASLILRPTINNPINSSCGG